MEKSARGFWGGLNKLVTKGSWSFLDDAAKASTGRLGKIRPITKVMSGKPIRYAGYYGLAGMVSPLAGINLPGSSLALGLSMPGFEAMRMGGNAIRTARMGSIKNQNALRADVDFGARQAGQDFISSLQHDPSVTYQSGQFRRFLEQQGRSPAMLDYYRDKQYRPMSTWDKIKSGLNNPQDLINSKTDGAIYNHLNKSASWMGKLTGTALPWAFGALGLGGASYAAFSNPYDKQEAQQRGYAAAQMQMQNRINNLTGMERFGLQLDPTMAVNRLEKYMPGITSDWEKSNGQDFNKGWLSKLRSTKPEDQEFYTWDAYGNRRYI